MGDDGMREEIIIPYFDLDDNILIRYREHEDGMSFLNIYQKVYDGDGYPIDCQIFVVDSIGIGNVDEHIRSGDSTTIKMNTTVFI
jgi:hypothetical protein